MFSDFCVALLFSAVYPPRDIDSVLLSCCLYSGTVHDCVTANWIWFIEVEFKDLELQDFLFIYLFLVLC